MLCCAMLCCAVLQVSVIRSVEIELEAALEKLRGAAKDLQKGVKEAMKMAADAQKDLKQYMPGGQAFEWLMPLTCPDADPVVALG